MKLRELFDQWSLTGLKINVGFLDAEFHANDQDKDAAWAMYVELLTRITTQPLSVEQGDEGQALASIHSLFAITRDILKAPGRRQADHFAKVAIIILNQKVRPFTAFWHRASLANAFADPARSAQFRMELATLQDVLTRYAGVLSELAGVEDFTRLEVD